MKKPRILILASLSQSLLHFRGDFITNLIDNGYNVYTAAPNNPSSTINELKRLGAIPLEFSLERTGINPYKDLKSITEVKSIIKKYNIDIVFPYTIKPVIYGSIAANTLDIPVISLITGLGFSFTGLSSKARIMQFLNEILYKISIRQNKVVVFQNQDDYSLFLDRNILTPRHNVAFVSGSGVNLKKYKFRENKNNTNTIRFLFVARLIKEKGIDLFIEAAQKLKRDYPTSEFHVIGKPDKSPSAIKISKLNLLHEQKIIVYHGQQDNVPEHLDKTDVFVLPSFYREGIPRSILEALSVGLPIITTNTPGCKETVKKGENGILIKPQDLDELTNAMEYFLINNNEIKRMGLNSRKYAEERFDVKLINNDLLNIIGQSLNNNIT